MPVELKYSCFKNILLTPLADHFTCFKQNALNLGGGGGGLS